LQFRNVITTGACKGSQLPQCTTIPPPATTAEIPADIPQEIRKRIKDAQQRDNNVAALSKGEPPSNVLASIESHVERASILLDAAIAAPSQETGTAQSLAARGVRELATHDRASVMGTLDICGRLAAFRKLLAPDLFDSTLKSCVSIIEESSLETGSNNQQMLASDSALRVVGLYAERDSDAALQLSLRIRDDLVRSRALLQVGKDLLNRVCQGTNETRKRKNE
jgi:hypothetical protein